MHLTDPRLAAILEREHAAADDQRAAHRVAPAAKTANVDFRSSDRQRSSYLAIGPDQGQWLHGLALATGARRIVEFGTSFGISALYLASAANTNGGTFTGSEYHQEKAKRARATLAEAGLGDADIRLGDARETLATPAEPIDLLFLDGAKELYSSMLDLLVPQLAARAVVVADNIDTKRPELGEFLTAINEARAWTTSFLAFRKCGMSFSVRM